MASVGQLKKINKKYGDQIQIFFVYTREAHAIDSARSNHLSTFEQPVTIEERRSVALEFIETADFDLPALLDDIDDTASAAYASLPDRFYLIGKDGKIAFAGDKGPRGLKPDLLQKAIEIEVKKIAAASPTEKDGEEGRINAVKDF